MNNNNNLHDMKKKCDAESYDFMNNFINFRMSATRVDKSLTKVHRQIHERAHESFIDLHNPFIIQEKFLV